MNLTRYRSALLIAGVMAALLLMVWRAEESGESGNAPAEPPPEPAQYPALAASDISPQQLLSDAPGSTSVVRAAAAPDTGVVTGTPTNHEAGVVAPPASSSAPPRVVMSRVFAPYTSPATMISLNAPEGMNAPAASPDFVAFKKWSEAQATGSGTAYLNLTAMLGAAPTGEVVRRTWINADAGTAGETTTISPVLAMITRPLQEPSGEPEQATTASDAESIARVMYYVREGDAKMSEGLLQEAAKAYTDALAIYPELTYANQQVGRLNLVLGNYPEAIKNLRAALEASDDIGETLNDLGVAYMYDGQIDEALEMFEAALQAEPEQMDPVFNTGLALRQGGRLVEAREQFNLYLNIIPRDARAMRELAVIDMLENQRETALRRLIVAIEYDGSWATPMLDAALLFAELGVNDRALALLEMALEHAPSREVYQVYMQEPFKNIRLSPEGKPFEAKLAGKVRKGL